MPRVLRGNTSCCDPLGMASGPAEPLHPLGTALSLSVSSLSSAHRDLWESVDVVSDVRIVSLILQSERCLLKVCVFV